MCKHGNASSRINLHMCNYGHYYTWDTVNTVWLTEWRIGFKVPVADTWSLDFREVKIMYEF